MRCKGLHCGGCESGRGGGRLGLLLIVGVIGLIVLPEVAGSALSGLSASVAEANRAVGLGAVEELRGERLEVRVVRVAVPVGVRWGRVDREHRARLAHGRKAVVH